MKKKIIKVNKKAFDKIKAKITLPIKLPKCKHKWEYHDCGCDFCDMDGTEICYECMAVK